MSWQYIPNNQSIESYLCSLESEGVQSDQKYSDSEPSATSKRIHSVDLSWRRGSMMESSTTPQSGIMLEPSKRIHGQEKSISLQPVFLANRSPKQGTKKQKTMSEICGQIPFQSSAVWSLMQSCWKTSQTSLILNTSERYAETWPRSGIIVYGELFPLEQLELPIRGNDSGYLPTPTGQDPKIQPFLRANFRGIISPVG